MKPEQLTLRANDIDIFYEKAGEGPPLVLLHGNGEDHSFFDAAAAELAKEWTVYAPDSRCHGKSTDTPELSYDDMANDTAEFIWQLALQRPVVLGFSDEGIVGLLVAMRQPGLLGGLIACGANLNPGQMKWRWRAMMRAGYFFKKDKKLALMLEQPDIKPQQLAGIELPVLVAAGARDIISEDATRGIAKAIRGSELCILKGHTHSSYLKDAELTAQLVRPFLGRR